MNSTATTSFTGMLAGRGVLIADGATGTNYQTMGMEPGLAPEEWLFEAPERVVELHRAFADAGADIVLTCTFGATPLRLTEGPLAGRVRDVNITAAQLGAGRRRPESSRRRLARSHRPADRAVRPARPRGSDRGLRRAGTGARRGRRRPARARDDLRGRGGRLGRRGHPERHRPAARRLVQLRHGHPDDDGPRRDRRRCRPSHRSGSPPSARTAAARSPTPTSSWRRSWPPPAICRCG